ncbi:MAG TPA: TIR domain-containing protein [Thermoanaerobaculia bacterium]|jgi:hypothetical protein|nr:TIR domain-containing protein [Thermoanaerobaculia bacterium]
MKKKICISYSRQDFRWVEFVLDALESMSHIGSVWYDKKIAHGAPWEEEIERQFSQADGFLVLASGAFFSSSFVQTFELPLILRRVKEKGALLLWLSLDRRVEEVPQLGSLARELANFQAVVPSLSPLKSQPEHEWPEMKGRLAQAFSLALEASPTGIELEKASWTHRVARPTSNRQTALFQAYLNLVEEQAMERSEKEGPRRSAGFFPAWKLYVNLRADPTPFGEREAARENLKETISQGSEPRDESEERRAGRAVDDAIRVKESQGQAQIALGTKIGEKAEFLETIFERERFLVIRGDPGSGKTMLCSRLSLSLAQRCRSRSLFESGGASPRIPILVSVRRFAAALERADGNLSVLKFLGFHMYEDLSGRPGVLAAVGEAVDWRSVGDSSAHPGPSELNALLRAEIEADRAVLFFDGLDEVPLKWRGFIVNEIEEFTDYIYRRLGSKALTSPGRDGGNQIVITSRVAGYEWAPISLAYVRHFLIRQLDADAIYNFCLNWAKFRNRELDGPALARLMLDERNRVVRSLGTNPLLLSVLCDLALPDQENVQLVGILPTARSEIYLRSIEAMASRWLRAADEEFEYKKLAEVLSPDRVMYLLGYVAFRMHTDSLTGRLLRLDLFDLLVEASIPFVGAKPTDLPGGQVRAFCSALIDFLARQVGVFAELTPGLFGFLHLTFQEFLAGFQLCLSLGTTKWCTAEVLAQSILDRFEDPRWREPILLALGFLSLAEEKRKSSSDLSGIPAQPYEVVRLLGASGETPTEEMALLLADLLVEIPEPGAISFDARALLQQIVRLLVRAYQAWGPDSRQESGRERVAEALAVVRRRELPPDQPNQVAVGFDTVLIDLIATNDELAPAAAHLVWTRCWLHDGYLAVFRARWRVDSSAWRWPMHSALRRSVADGPLETEVVSKLDLPVDLTEDPTAVRRHSMSWPVWERLRIAEAERILSGKAATSFIGGMVEQNPTLSMRIRSDRELLRAVVTVFGGIEDLQCARWAQEYDELASFLQQSEPARESEIDTRPDLYVVRWGVEDVVYNCALYLDQAQGGRSKLRERACEVRPLCMTRSSSLEALFQRCLNPVGVELDLSSELERETRFGGEDEKAEAFLALRAMGRTSSTVRSSSVGWFAQRTTADLQDGMIRSSNDVARILCELCKDLEPGEDALLYREVCRCVVSAAGRSARLPTIDLGAASPWLRAAVQAEQWASRLIGFGDDPTYNLAVQLDTAKFDLGPETTTRILDSVLHSSLFPFIPAQGPPTKFWGLGNSSGSTSFHFFEKLHSLSARAEQVGPQLGAGLLVVFLRQLFQQRPPLPEVVVFSVLTGVSEEIKEFPLSSNSLPVLIDYLDSCWNNGDSGLRAHVGLAWHLLDGYTGHALGITRSIVFGRSALEDSLRSGEPCLLSWLVQERGGSFSEEERAKVCDHIEDWSPWDRALLLASLAEVAPSVEAGRLMSEVYEISERHTDRHDRAELLSRLAQYANRLNLDEAHRKASHALGSPVFVAHAEGRLSEVIPKLGASSEELLNPSWAVFCAYTTCKSFIVQETDAASRTELWRRLQEATCKPAADLETPTRVLLSVAESGGLGLNPAAVEALEAIAAYPDTKEAEGLLYRLLPCIGNPSLASEPALERWLESGAISTSPGYRLLSQFAGLLLAERTGRLERRWLEGIVELAESGDDLAIARANLILGGPDLRAEREDRRFRLSRLGPEPLEWLLDRRHQEVVEDRVTSEIRLCIYDWWIDDLQSIERWFQPESPRHRLWTLFNWTDAWTEDCQSRAARWIESLEGPLPSVVTEWIGRLVSIKSSGLSDKLMACIQRIELPETRLISLDDSLVAVVDACGKEYVNGGEESVALARRTYLKYTVSLREHGVGAIGLLGDVQYQPLSDVPEKGVTIPGPLGSSERFLLTCLRWLDEELEIWLDTEQRWRCGEDVDRWTSVILVNALLCLATVLTQQWPERFARYCLDPHEQTSQERRQDLLKRVALRARKMRSSMAAITLLSRMPAVAPDLACEVLENSVHRGNLVRQRALSCLPAFRSFSGSELSGSILKRLDNRTTASSTLVKAQLLCTLIRENMVDSKQRQRILQALRLKAQSAASDRYLGHLGGNGDTGDQRKIVTLGRLDLELRNVLGSLMARRN